MSHLPAFEPEVILERLTVINKSFPAHLDLKLYGFPAARDRRQRRNVRIHKHTCALSIKNSAAS